ncbi:MAG: GxxExxY protein [Candidatus Omnitrophica bacterium]|nr:GxxExxY protein [Candidatus Omnitrophota bacterium]MBU1871393.1 GxxExxY protein [Candidatus Omnitrophota bacterium]
MIEKKITEIKSRDPLTEKIIACAYKVHSELGPGFNEGIYHNALKMALEDQGLKYQAEKGFNVLFHGKDVGKMRLDLIIEDKIIVEIKALTGNIPTVFELQVLSYLKASGYKIGLLINFANKSCQVRRLMV